MENINISSFNAITNFENIILNTKKHSASSLAADLHQLSDFRKDTYSEFIQTLNQVNNDITILFEEYDQYCNFIIELLTNKTLSNSSWSRILNNFAHDYALIKQFDTNNFALNATLTTLEYLRDTCLVSNSKTSDYRFRCVEDLINQYSLPTSTDEKEF